MQTPSERKTEMRREKHIDSEETFAKINMGGTEEQIGKKGVGAFRESSDKDGGDDDVIFNGKEMSESKS